MKKIILLSTIILAFGCTKETTGPSVKEGSVTMTLNANAATKVAYNTTPGSASAKWETGDVIYLIKKEKVITFALSEAGSSEGRFTTSQKIIAGDYIPIAVSKSSADKGYVSMADDGTLTIYLNSLDGTLEDALRHDVLIGDPLPIRNGQAEASIENLKHFLSYIKIKVNGSGLIKTGIQSGGGLYQKLIISPGSNKIDEALSEKSVSPISAGNDPAGGAYTAFVPIFPKTAVNMQAYAQKENGDEYEVVFSTKGHEYEAGEVYQKTVNLSDMAQVSGRATGTNKNGLTTTHKWVRLYVGGPKWSTRNIDLAQDSLETVSDIAYHTPDNPLTAGRNERLMSKFQFGSVNWTGASDGGYNSTWPEANDVAKLYWGGDWRIPTHQLLSDLANDSDMNRQYTDANYIWTKYVLGVKSTSAWANFGDGSTEQEGNYMTVQYIGQAEISTGLTLTFPAAGHSHPTNIYDVGFACNYRSTEPYGSYAWYLNLTNGTPSIANYYDRNWATPIKPVIK